MKIKTNSKDVKKNDIFVCIHDEFDDRHKYINSIKKAGTIIVDKDIKKNISIPIIRVNDTNDTLFQMYNSLYNNPLDNLNIIGITGTDGKTTTASIIKELLDNFVDCAYLGTNGFSYKNKVIATRNTTPFIGTTLKFANILKKEDISNLVMEVSSEGLLHNRCNNLNFKVCIITNVTGDHLNIHKSFDNYLNSKLKLFDLVCDNGIIIINTDDISYRYLKNKKYPKNKNIKIVSYGFKKYSDYRISNICLRDDGSSFDLIFKGIKYHINSPLLGKFNIYNLTASLVCLVEMGFNIYDIIEYINYLNPIPGRMNIFYTKKKAKIILDYAHTLNSTRNILKFSNDVKNGKIITVLGCAGGREKEKRKDIGKIACLYSDKVIFTMDDPRYEKVKDIVNDLVSEVKSDNYIYIKNRKKAIKYAIKIANEDDLILVLGKGCDNYMAIKNKYKKYSDLKVIKKYI